MKKEITNVDLLSLGSILGLIYVFIGLIVGLLFATIGSIAGNLGGEDNPLLFGLGTASVVVFPLIYGAIGFIVGIITAAIYNLVAGWVGGVKVTVKDLDQ